MNKFKHQNRHKWRCTTDGRDSLLDAGDWKTAPNIGPPRIFADALAAAGGLTSGLAADVVLESSVLNRSITGRENVKLVMACASTIYQRLEFTKEAADGSRRYLEWRARAFDHVEIKGVTIIRRNEAGAIAHLACHYRPLAAALQFSVELGRRLDGAISDSYFLPSATSTITS
jgi:hypothetical protein